MPANEIIVEQPKYFDRKRRLLAAEQQISPSEVDTLITKKCSPHKKACLDDIVDSLKQKAQAEKMKKMNKKKKKKKLNLKKFK